MSDPAMPTAEQCVAFFEQWLTTMDLAEKDFDREKLAKAFPQFLELSRHYRAAVVHLRGLVDK